MKILQPQNIRAFFSSMMQFKRNPQRDIPHNQRIRYLCTMQTNRQKRIERLLQKELSHILQFEGRNWFSGSMVTVTKVSVSPDLGIAKVFLSIYGKDPSGAMKQIEMRVKEIRKILGIQVRNQLRAIPDLRFFVDDSLDYIENIEKLLRT